MWENDSSYAMLLIGIELDILGLEIDDIFVANNRLELFGGMFFIGDYTFSISLIILEGEIFLKHGC